MYVLQLVSSQAPISRSTVGSLFGMVNAEIGAACSRILRGTLFVEYLGRDP
jgi:hypothetical protein